MSVVDLFVSGLVKGADTVLSSPGRIWNESTQSFSGVGALDSAYGDGAVIAVDITGVPETSEIRRSTDGGRAFGSSISHNHSNGIISIEFGDGVFIAAGEAGELSRSTNAGVTWGSLVSNAFATNNDTIWDLAFDSKDKVWVAVGESSTCVLRSTDGGATWSAPSTPFNTASTHVVYAGGSTFIADNNGDATSLWRSTDAGDTWVAVEIDNNLIAQYNRGLAYGDGVVIASLLKTSGTDTWYAYRSVDGGATWDRTLSTTTDTVGYGAEYCNGIFFIGKYLSRDGGLTFTTGFLTGERGGVIPSNVTTIYSYTYDPDYHRICAVGQILDGSYQTYCIYSDWLEAGAGIVEQGTNSNGSYIIFSSGVQVCWAGNIDVASTSLQDKNIGTYGWSYYSGNASVTFPKAFGAKPVVTVSGDEAGADGLFGYRTDTVATTGFRLVGWAYASTTYSAGYIAIGWAA